MRRMDYRQWIGNAAIIFAVLGSGSLVTWGYTRDWGKAPEQNPFETVEAELASGIIREAAPTGQARTNRTTRSNTSTLAQGRTTAQPNQRNQGNQGNQNNNQGGRGGGRTTVNTGNTNMSTRGGGMGGGGGRGGMGGGRGGMGGGGYDPGAQDPGMDTGGDPTVDGG